MNEFLAKKTGEILAFSRMTKEAFERGKEALSSVILPKEIEEIAKESSLLSSEIEKVSEHNEVKKAVLDKAEKTGEKIKKMQNLYLQEEDWKDPAEIFEWLGFFEGAAVVHFSLVLGKARDAGANDLTEVAAKGEKMHRDLLEKVSLLIRKV